MNRIITILMLSLTAIFLTFSACSDDESTAPSDDNNGPTIVGNWLSTGSNVAPLLAGFGIVEITAEFNSDNTYTVVSTDTASVAITFTGTYSATESGVGNIFDITLNQNTPSQLTSVGIFEIEDASPETMRYEVIQTEPTLGVAPPTAADGFGSSGGGAFLTTNIQNFVRQ